MSSKSQTNRGYAAPSEQPPALMFDSERWNALVLTTASHRERLAAFAYNNSLLFTASLQGAIVVLFLIVDPHTLQTGYAMNVPMSLLLCVLELVQLAFIVAAHSGMLKELLALYVRPTKIWNIYVSTLVCYTALYFTCFCYDRGSFNVDGYAPDDAPDSAGGLPDTDTQNYNDVPTVFVFFLYFSGAIMTSTGFGDIAPAKWYTQFFSNSQMLVGLMYHVGVFGLTLSHFRQFQRMTEEEKEKRRQQEAQQDPSMLASVMHAVSSLQLARRMKEVHPFFDVVRRWCIRHLFWVTAVSSVLITLLLYAIPGSDPFATLTSADGSAFRIKIAVLSIMVFLESILAILIVFVSIRLVKQINSTDLSANFLIQSYLSTALLFGGIYFILYAATPHHQFSRRFDSQTSIFEVLYIFLHFSFTVMTTTGFGDIYARGIIARGFVLVEMLVSILYNAVIIGLGTSQLIDLQSAEAEKKFQEVKAEATHSRQASLTDELDLQDVVDDEDDEEDEEDNPFDREAAQRRREQRRAAGGDHIQLNTLIAKPIGHSIAIAGDAHTRAIDGKEDEVEDEDASENHLFGQTGGRGKHDAEQDDEEEELDMRTYGSVEGDDVDLDEPDDDQAAADGDGGQQPAGRQPDVD